MSDIDTFNPYSPPQAPLEVQTLPTIGDGYYAMSTKKLWLMSILTFGLYDLCFWWRHWRHIRDLHDEDISVFWRTVFSPFMYFDFNNRVKETIIKGGSTPRFFFRAAPVIYLIASVISRILDRTSNNEDTIFLLLSIALLLVSTFSLATTQRAINKILERDGYQGTVNNRVTGGAVAMGLIGVLIWSLFLASAIITGEG